MDLPTANSFLAEIMALSSRAISERGAARRETLLRAAERIVAVLAWAGIETSARPHSRASTDELNAHMRDV